MFILKHIKRGWLQTFVQNNYSVLFHLYFRLFICPPDLKKIHFPWKLTFDLSPRLGPGSAAELTVRPGPTAF